MTAVVLAIADKFDRSEATVLATIHKSGIPIRAIVSEACKYKSILVDSGVTVILHRFRGRLAPRSIAFLRREIQENNIQIAHCFSNRALSNLNLAAWGTGIKRIAYRGTVGHVSRFAPLSWLTYLNPNIDKIICISNAVAKFLSSMVDEEKLITIYKGVDPSWYDPNKKADLMKFGVPHNSFIVACVANMRPVKGVSYLIQAIDSLPKDLPIHLVLVGDVRDDQIKRHAAHSFKVHTLGYQDDVAAILTNATLFVMPSVEREGLSKALLEAMSLGIAPIVTRVGGMPEVVTHEQNGLVVSPRSPEELAAAILRLYKNEEERLSFARNAKNTIYERFNLDGTTHETMALYRRLLSCQS